jgi:hypothetical protein
MPVATVTQLHTLPLCPPWCSSPSGHSFSDVDPSGERFRFHTVVFGDVEVQWDESSITGLRPPVIYVDPPPEDLDVERALKLSRELVAAAMLISRVSR